MVKQVSYGKCVMCITSRGNPDIQDVLSVVGQIPGLIINDNQQNQNYDF